MWQRHPLLSILAVLSGLLAFYLALFLRYRPYDIDTPWFLSFSYDTCVEHRYTDLFMDTPFPRGMDGTQFFGKLAAWTQWAALSHFGWQQWPAIVLSSVAVVLAMWLWCVQLRRLGYGIAMILPFLVGTGFSEPLLSAANKARYEFLSFPMIALALVLIAYDWTVAGAFVAGLAVEVQPVAICGLLPVLLLSYSRSSQKAALLGKLAVGFALAGAVYFALHPRASEIRGSLHGGGGVPLSFDWGFFRSYFIDRIRHLPELICFAVAGLVYWVRRRAFRSHYLALSALAMMLFSMLMPHGNPAYMIFAYPFFIALTVLALRLDERPWGMLVLVLILYLPQYLFVMRLTRGMGYRTSDIAKVSQMIARDERKQGLDDRTVPIYGDYRLWFAHPHFYRASTGGTLSDIAGSELFLCYDHPPEPAELEPQFMLYCRDFKQLAPLDLRDTVDLRGNRIYLYARRH